MNNYDEIINYPHYELKYHKRMSKSSRASQFASFQALTGYEEEVEETRRLTSEKIELSEDKKTLLNNSLQILEEHIKERPLITITYFEKDKKKRGGSYQEYRGHLKKIDSISHTIILVDKREIPIENIVKISQ